MFGAIRSKLGMVRVYTTPKFIVVEGINTYSLTRDIQRLWGTSSIAKYMFSTIRSGELKLMHFFGPDFVYICKTLLEDHQSRCNKRMLKKILEELHMNTWLGNVDKQMESITDMSVVDHVVPFPLKPFQKEFAKHFGVIVPTYNLKGYMLDAGPGSGKTVTDLVIGEALHADKVFILSPNNAIDRVWKDTIENLLVKKRSYWISNSGELPSLDAHYYICHYESLEKLLTFAKANARDLKNVFVILDESHNFNRMAADRTKMFVELCAMKSVSYVLWASGTPIQALGSECIPFLKTVDLTFTDEAEERFRKIYGRDAKRANDILRNRIGHLKFHVPSQDVVDVKVNVEQVKVTMPDAETYTLENISNILRKFIGERLAYYEKNYVHYKDKYEEGIKLFEPTLKTEMDHRQYKAYQAAFKTVSSGFDAKLMKAEAQLCNQYELKTIIPTLPNALKPEFKSARSVIKYVQLKVMGEALGRIVGGMRSKCHMDMINYIDFEKYIDGAKKKTLVFTSYVEVLTTTADLLEKKGYAPEQVYGGTNKNLAAIVDKFYKDEDANPLVATYQSLSTAVPLTVANRLLMLNQPFRDSIRKQTIARAARLGQDEAVDVFDFLLDTGDKPNISTRSNDILEWSASMVASIVGVNNLDLDTLTLEDRQTAINELTDAIADEDEPEFKAAFTSVVEGEDVASEAHDVGVMPDLPPYLYHGSAYLQQEIQPGFNHSGNLVKWDGSEDNTWLYASDDKNDAVMLGISSAIEKKFKLDRYAYDQKARTLKIEVSESLTMRDITNLHVVLYTIKATAADGWMANHNPQNNISGEYKTQHVIKDNLVNRENIDVARALNGLRVNIVINKEKTQS